jgi:TolB protein
VSAPLVRAVLACALLCSSLFAVSSAHADPDQTLLGEFLIVGNDEDSRPTLAILPSLAPDLEDVIVRGVVRRDFELTGLFRMLADQKAPAGSYGFEDPVDVAAWRNVGAQVVVKVAARRAPDSDKIQVIGLAYLLASGSSPVFREVLTVQKEDVRVTAHRVTDALLEALTGRRGGFASHMTFSGKWAKNPTVFTVDADGHNLTRVTEPEMTSLSPVWGPGGSLFYSESNSFSPFRFMALTPAKAPSLPFPGSIYAASFSPDGTKLAVSVDEKGGSAIYVGKADGTGMKKVSNTLVSVRPVFSPSGKLAWVGGAAESGTQRVYLDGKPVSPSGFSASSPSFCDTEDGIRLVFSVSIGGGRSDLVWTTENGKGIARLTQNSGSNTSPACSPDGRLLAYFSERKQEAGLYIKSLKSFTSQKITGRLGQSLHWAALPDVLQAPATPRR